MELYIIRHGETVWNAQGLLQGEKNIQLNEKGIAAAENYGKEIENIHFDKIYCSPLERAVKTAELIRGSKDIEIIKDNRLRELCFGNCEGTYFGVWKDQSCPYHWFFDNPEKYTPPENGETLESLCSRTKEFIQTVIEPEAKIYSRIMIVAHGALNAAIMKYLDNNDLKHFWGTGLQNNCQASIYTFDGKWKIIKR